MSKNCVVTKKQWISFSLGKNDSSRTYVVKSIAVDKNNNIWFATEDGILMLKQDTLAIDLLFIKEGVEVKNEFKQPFRQQKKEMAFYDLLGRKCLKTGDIFKKTNGIILGFDNFRVKKIAIVK
jgi:hypothetical protein